MQSAYLTVLSVALVAVFSVGCSVSQNVVENKPPVINRSLKKYTTEIGSISPQVVSAFLWPDYALESDIENVVNQVNVKGQELDRLFQKGVELDRERRNLQVIFEEKSCLDYAENTRSKWDVDEWVTEWTTLDENASVEEQAKLQECINNQNEREPIMVWLNASPAQPGEPKVDSYLQEFEDIREAIYALIDPGYTQDNQLYVNRKDVQAVGSLVVIGGEGIEIRLAGFIKSDFNPSSKAPEGDKEHIWDVSYNPDTKLLKFKINAPDVEGAVYEFTLERAPDLLHEVTIGDDTHRALVRFLGDMNLTKDGVVLRYGSAKILGEISGE